MAWTFVEYAIHGWMAHRFATFATALHNAHHLDPSAVFALGAWPPTLIVWLATLVQFGATPATLFFSGIVAGFAVYEAVHYRFHFALPSCAIERRLRTRHLAHHFRAPESCFGVTTALWDIVFNTQLPPAAINFRRDELAAIAPLKGSSNFGRLLARLRVNFAAFLAS